MGVETAVIIAGAVAAAGAVGSAAMSSASAKKNNQAAMGFNEWSQLQSQAYNSEMYERQLNDQKEMYDAFQSPKAIASQLRQAGINPNALFSKGAGVGSMPSVPSGGSSSPVGAPALENEGAYLGQGFNSAFQSISGAFSQVASIKNQDAQTKAVLDKLEPEIKLMVAERQSKEAATVYQNILNETGKWSIPETARSNINNLISSAYVNYCNGDYQQALSSFTKVQEQIGSEELKIKKEEAATIADKIASLLRLTKAQEKAALSSAAESSASAKLLGQQFETEKYETTIKSIEAENSEVAKLDKLNALLSDLHRQASENKQKKLAADIQRFRDSLNDPRNKDSGRQKVDVGLDWLRQKFGFGVSSTISLNK